MAPTNGPAIRPADATGIAAAAALLRAGSIVAVPTETVYGLAADARSVGAVAAIYRAKGRPSFNPLIVHVAGQGMAERLGRSDERARNLAHRFWPGPLTLVLPRVPGAAVAGAVTAGLDSIALRCPAHPVMQALISAVGRPLAAPSANASGTISPTRAAHVAASLGAKVPLILDGGATSSGIESTILALDEEGWRLLRPGPIALEKLTDLLGPPLPPRERIEAPGQLTSHYAPAKPLRLNASEARDGEYRIGFGASGGDETLSASGDLAEAAARLFDALHRADASSAEAIAVAPIPDEGIGRAINDRLRRAAAPR